MLIKIINYFRINIHSKIKLENYIIKYLNYQLLYYLVKKYKSFYIIYKLHFTFSIWKHKLSWNYIKILLKYVFSHRIYDSKYFIVIQKYIKSQH